MASSPLCWNGSTWNSWNGNSYNSTETQFVTVYSRSAHAQWPV